MGTDLERFNAPTSQSIQCGGPASCLRASQERDDLASPFGHAPASQHDRQTSAELAEVAARHNAQETQRQANERLDESTRKTLVSTQYFHTACGSLVRVAFHIVAAAGAEFQINTDTDGNQRQPTVTSLTDGSFVVMSEFLKSRLGAGCADH